MNQLLNHAVVVITFAPLAHGQNAKLYYQEKKPKLLLLHSGCALTLYGTAMLIVVRVQHEGSEILSTATLTCAWGLITGIIGICTSCLCPNGGDLLDCYTDITKCKKRIALICYRIYLSSLLLEMCAAIGLIGHSTAVGVRKQWRNDMAEMSCLFLGTATAVMYFLLACAVIYDMRDFMKQHKREHGCAAAPARARERDAAHPPTVSAPTVPADRVSLPPPYCEQFSRALLPTYDMAAAEQPLLHSTLTVENGRLIELPPSYSLVMDSNSG